MDNIFRNYERQNYPEKELIIILNDDEMDLHKWREKAKEYHNVSVYRRSSDKSLGECLNYGIKRSKYDTIAKFDDDDYYTSRYLMQQLNALERKKADVVCKRSVYMYFMKERTLAVHLAHQKVNVFVNNSDGIKGSTLVFRKKVGERVKFPELNRGEDSFFLKNCMKRNHKVYVTDKRNYVCLRMLERYHTWRARNAQLLRDSKIVCRTIHYKKFVESKQ